MRNKNPLLHLISKILFQQNKNYDFERHNT